MTNPQGYMFISYRSTQVLAVLRMRRALEEYGIPVWLDEDNMLPGKLEHNMTSAVRSQDCAGAVVWISKDMTTSAAIQRIELPEIIHRIQRADEFIVIFCLADGLTFEDAQTTLLSGYSNIDLKSFLIQRFAGSTPEDQDIEAVARMLLEKRIQVIHTTLPKEEALRIQVAGHAEPAKTVEHALVLNYHHHFSGRFASEEAWQSKILPALDLVASTIVSHAPGRAITAGGTPQLSLALALGYAFRTPRGLQASWVQVFPDATLQQWSIESTVDNQGFLIEHSTDLLHGEDMAVLIGVTHDPQPTFDASAGTLPHFGAVIRVTPKGKKFPARILGGLEASSLTQEVVRYIRVVMREARLQGCVHLFIAAPAGLAFLLGRQLNTFGKVYCYEHEASGPIGVYRPNLAMST